MEQTLKTPTNIIHDQFSFLLYYDWRPIHEASFNGNFEAVQFLIQNGAEIDSLTNGLIISYIFSFLLSKNSPAYFFREWFC